MKFNNGTHVKSRAIIARVMIKAMVSSDMRASPGLAGKRQGRENGGEAASTDRKTPTSSRCLSDALYLL